MPQNAISNESLLAPNVQATTQGRTLSFCFFGMNVCGLERILLITPNPVSTLPLQIDERRGCVCYAFVGLRDEYTNSCKELRRLGGTFRYSETHVTSCVS